ncbi:MAG: hypothetical protein GDA35_05100 [Hyphomonadaceae bacterium]|nr:hypothetical protein [Hyphomonadaceae bacterium]
MKKKKIEPVVSDFRGEVDKILDFAEEAKAMTEKHQSWCHDLAIIRIYTAFEDLMLDCLVVELNNNSEDFSKHKGVKFPKHMNAQVCKFLICGDGYFSFSGRGGLIREIRKNLPRDHWLIEIVKDETYTDTLDKLIALRNFAAHSQSPVAKKRAREAIKQKRLHSSGVWLKSQGRLDDICKGLKVMAERIESDALL